MGGGWYRCVSDTVWAGKTGHCVEIVKGGLSMSDKLIMLVAICFSTAWRVLTLSGLVG
ncbi:hypothetical protein [Escherichia coli]|uniref:hypothetical protein n=1 Tax=Escherichia coli TaxID=562 RepID=UPI0025970CFB|nr:hypothetical protein [Escherichia coli]MDM4053860.1 hypothetical protein [Escherichia coli]